MSTPEQDVVRKVRQLDHDVQAIYEMLATIGATQQRQGNRLEEIASEQIAQRTVFDAHSATLNEHSATLNEHSTTLNEHSTKLDHIIRLLEG